MTEETGTPRREAPGNGAATKSKDTLVEDWKIVEAMGRARIRKIADLTERLNAVGLKISAPQVSRIVKGPPKYLSIDLLKALIVVLDCELSDLIVFNRVTSEEARENAPEPASPARPGLKTGEPPKPKGPAERRKPSRRKDPDRSLLASMPDDGDGESGEPK